MYEQLATRSKYSPPQFLIRLRECFILLNAGFVARIDKAFPR